MKQESEVPVYRDEDFEVRFHRSTGKGGQRKNKVATCCVITHIPSGLSQKADGRSRLDNEEEAKSILLNRLMAIYDQATHTESNMTRKSSIGTGARGNRKRLFRLQDDMVIDHVAGKSASCKDFLKGKIDKIW